MPKECTWLKKLHVSKPAKIVTVYPDFSVPPTQHGLSDTDKQELILDLCKTNESQWEDFGVWCGGN